MPISCDEAYLYLPLSMEEAVAVVNDIRTAIYQSTECHASAGIGSNLLLARLATKKAKPNGCFVMNSSIVAGLMKDMDISEIPGVGYSTARKLREAGYTTCGLLREAKRTTIQSLIGERTGALIHSFANAIDTRPFVSSVTTDPSHKNRNLLPQTTTSSVPAASARKSIAVDCNYGVRLRDVEHAHSFLSSLSLELLRRLESVHFVAYTVTIKVMKRSATAPLEPPYKFLGHGECDTFHRSRRLTRGIRLVSVDHQRLVTLVIEMFDEMKIAADWVRGVGILFAALQADKEYQTKSIPTVSDSNNHQQLDVEVDDASSVVSSVKPYDDDGVRGDHFDDNIERWHIDDVIIDTNVDDLRDEDGDVSDESEWKDCDIITLTQDDIKTTMQQPQQQQQEQQPVQSALQQPLSSLAQEQAPSILYFAAESSRAVISAQASSTTMEDLPNISFDVFLAKELEFILSLPPYDMLDRTLIPLYPLDVRQELANAYKKKTKN